MMIRLSTTAAKVEKKVKRAIPLFCLFPEFQGRGAMHLARTRTQEW